MEWTTEQLLAELEAAIKGSGITVTNALGNTILNPQQFDKFVQVMQNKVTILNKYRFQKMDSHKLDIDMIVFGSRIMGVPAAEGQPKPEIEWVSPDFSMHQMEAQEMQGIVSLTDKMLRRNIEKQGLMDTVMSMIAERVGLDIEEQAINGDKLSADSFLALQDGWLKMTRRRVPEKTNQAYDDGAVPSFSTGAGETTKTVGYPKLPIKESTFFLYEDNTTAPPGVLVAHDDGAGTIVQDGGSGVAGTIDYESGVIALTGLTAVKNYAVKYTADGFDKTAAEFPENMFDRLVRVIPKTYYTKPDEWEINVPWWVLKAYRDRLKARYTSLGDEFQKNGGIRIPWEGSWIQYVPNMPKAKSWLTHPDNTIYGVFHEVQLESEREAKAKRTDIVVNAETAYDFEQREATVVADI